MFPKWKFYLRAVCIQVSAKTSELKITGTLPEAGNLKPNIWWKWNHQAPQEKHARSSGKKFTKSRQKTAKVALTGSKLFRNFNLLDKKSVNQVPIAL